MKNHLPASWYPLCRSSELIRGQAIKCDAFGLQLAVFRTASGKVGALSATCVHMGADLSRGRVVGERLQCPLHEWEYGREGICEHIPASTSIPRRARLGAMVCEEHYGIVFGFLGDQPSFPFPRFVEMDPSEHSAVSVTELNAAHETLAANTFDGQHFQVVHHRDLLEPPELSSIAAQHLCIRYRAVVAGKDPADRLMRAIGIKSVDNSIHCWGGSVMLVDNKRTSSKIISAIVPVDENHSRIFVVTILKKRGNRLIRRLMLAISLQLTLAFLRNDQVILENMQLRPRVLLPEADHSFIAWVKYWKALPAGMIIE